jgi:hypothetical protein
MKYIFLLSLLLIVVLTQINLCCMYINGAGPLQITNGPCAGGYAYNCDLSWLQQGNIDWNQIQNTPTTLDGYGIKNYPNR